MPPASAYLTAENRCGAVFLKNSSRALYMRRDRLRLPCKKVEVLMRPSKLIALAALGLPVLVACGSLADSDKVSPIATIQGALSASSSVPANAHVALVWRRSDGSGVTVVQDTPLVSGRFSFELNAPPADDLFFSSSGENSSGSDDVPIATSTGTGAPPPAVDAAAPTTEPKSLASTGLHTLTTVGGGIATPMSVAVAGFVLYVDANGNGKLDLEGAEASSPDTILGGNTELFLAYLRDGTQLAYEKLRDSTGTLPVHGYNLFWNQGTQANPMRVMPLDAVEIELRTDAKLPSTVCTGGDSTASSGGVDTGTNGSGGTATPPTAVDAGAPKPDIDADADVDADVDGGADADVDAGTNPSYPSPNDPNLHCSADGTSFTYSACGTPPPPSPVGLCTSSDPSATEPCASWGMQIPSPVPSNWPCPLRVDASTPPAD